MLRILDYAFTPHDAPILSGGQVGGDITLQTGDQSCCQKIPFKSAHCSHKTLKHYKEPSGNQTQQYHVLTEKSNDAEILFNAAPSIVRKHACIILQYTFPALVTHFLIVISS
jgi:hypothetical protein